MEKRAKVLTRISFLTRLLEYILCVLIALAVVLSLPDLCRQIIQIFSEQDISISYRVVNEFLRYSLLLVVGIELIIMLITHSNHALLNLVLFVIARKMLVYAETMLDLLIGTAAIAIVFAVMHFFAGDSHYLTDYTTTYNASLSLDQLKSMYGIDLTGDETINSLGGLVYQLAKRDRQRLVEGNHFTYKDYELVVVSMVNSTVKQVRIEKQEEL